jgi:GcrA cell cycle regulator
MILFTPAAPAWTAEQEAELDRLWCANELTTAQIGKKIGRTKNAVIGKANRMGLPPKTGKLFEPIPPRVSLSPPPMHRAASCAWPIGGPGQPDFRLCGAEIARGSYCATHAARASRRTLPELDVDATMKEMRL